MATPSSTNFHVARTFKVLQNYTPALTDAVFKKRGFYDTRLIHDWPNIIGTQWAASTFPEKLSMNRKNGDGGVLHIRTTSSDAFLLRHIEPQLIERINTYFGHTLVTSLRFIHDPHVIKQTVDKASLAVSIPPRPPTAQDAAKLEDISESLKEALLNLNCALAKT